MPALTPEAAGGSFKSLFGRLFGLLGDDLGHRAVWIGGANGRVVACTRKDQFITVTGSNGAGACTLTGARVGDQVEGIVRIDSSPADASASFEATITVADQIQQSSASNLSAQTFLVKTSRQS
jgi:hypothetical protein